MSPRSTLWRYMNVTKHFWSARAVEVLALQASPFLGSFLGGFILERNSAIRLCLLLLGSVALTAHVFVFNDWAGHDSDLRDPRRDALVFSARGILSSEVIRIAIVFLILSFVAFAAVGRPAILLGAMIAMLSLLYSCSRWFGKGAPIIASINHLTGGALHFLLGYMSFHVPDGRGIGISLFFGLVFAAGHLNQEVRDYEGDLLGGIRTSAVVFGCQRTFLASLCIFSGAYALAAVLAALGILPRLLLWSTAGWVLHVAWSVRAFRRGLGFETALWMQRRYRLLFAIIGLAMLIL